MTDPRNTRRRHSEDPEDPRVSRRRSSADGDPRGRRTSNSSPRTNRRSFSKPEGSRTFRSGGGKRKSRTPAKSGIGLIIADILSFLSRPATVGLIVAGLAVAWLLNFSTTFDPTGGALSNLDAEVQAVELEPCRPQIVSQNQAICDVLMIYNGAMLNKNVLKQPMTSVETSVVKDLEPVIKQSTKMLKSTGAIQEGSSDFPVFKIYDAVKSKSPACWLMGSHNACKQGPHYYPVAYGPYSRISKRVREYAIEAYKKGDKRYGPFYIGVNKDASEPKEMALKSLNELSANKDKVIQGFVEPICTDVSGDFIAPPILPTREKQCAFYVSTEPRSAATVTGK